MDNEIWKPVLGYEHIYVVSNKGVIKSIDHVVQHKDGKKRLQVGRLLKTCVSFKGYVQVSLSSNGKRFHTGVHRIVAISFIENPHKKSQVNHKDGNKLNNHVSNLEWCTNRENQIHAIKNNLIKHNTCQNHHMSKLSNADVLNIRQLHINNIRAAELSRTYNISQTAISNILKRKTYKSI